MMLILECRKRVAEMLKKESKSGFHCQECGHGFATVKAAEKASYSDDGCPKCGGSDIDLGRPAKDPVRS
jgi:Zn finger protein HypA/HybF involved in hydrogenase expression